MIFFYLGLLNIKKSKLLLIFKNLLKSIKKFETFKIQFCLFFKNFDGKRIIKPLLTVLMPVYNAEKFLAESINSILSQTYSEF